jgi:hypothetical protein
LAEKPSTRPNERIAVNGFFNGIYSIRFQGWVNAGRS